MKTNNYTDLYYNIDKQCNYYKHIPWSFNNTIYNTKYISIIHINARSLVSNLSNITNYLAPISQQFDIIAIKVSLGLLPPIKTY